MSYKLRFHELALAEWEKLDGSVREPLKKKLAERLDNPRVPPAALSDGPDCYKIKLKRIGYRVDGDVIFVTAISVGKRDRQKVYDDAQSRLRSASPKD